MIGKKASALLFALYAVLAISILASLSPEMMILKVPTAAAETVGVYWDPSCSQQVYSIDWGTLSRGGFKRHVIYARNEGSTDMIFVVIPRSWNPENAPDFLKFSWDSSESKVSVDQVEQITLDLKVETYISVIETFSFNVLILGLDHYQGDINRDGAVDMHDVASVARRFMSRVGDPGYDPILDLNMDDVIDMHDASTAAQDFGKKWT